VRTEFLYDGLNRRVRIVKRQSGQIVSEKRLLWCDDVICEERDSSGSVTNRRIFGAGFEESGSAFFQTKDHLESIREATDASNAIRARYDYDLFGRVTKLSGDVDTSYGFAGLYFEQSSGLLLANYREYDAALGRFTNADPIGMRGGINLYLYAEGNPARFIDPLGLQSESLSGFERENMMHLNCIIGQWGKTGMEWKAGKGGTRWAHCMASCRTKKCSNSEMTAKEAGSLKELWDVTFCLGFGVESSCGSAEQPQDHDDNEQGYTCPNNMSCEDRCKDLKDKPDPPPGPYGNR
jgi:RHS repeat-associated protein